MGAFQSNIAPQKKRFKRRLYEIFIVEKLYNLPGFMLLLAGSIICAATIACAGFTGVAVILAVIIGLPVVYAIIAYPRFGIIVIIVIAYLLFYIVRLGVNLPIGTLIDLIELFLIFGFFLGQKENPDWKIFRNPVSLMLIIWTLYLLVEVINPEAASRLAWLYNIRSMGVVSLMYFIYLYYIKSVSFIRIIINVWITLAFIGALYGYIQEFFGYSAKELEFINSDPLITSLYFVQGHWRKFSIFSDPVSFAYNMVIVVFLCLALLTYYKKLWKKIGLIILACFFTGSMFYSGTRGAYVLLPAGLILFAIMKLDRTVIIGSIISGVILAGLIFVPTSNPNIYRFQTAFRPSEDASFNVRTINQKKIQPYILSHPIGGGIGATGVWGQRFSPNTYLANFPPDSGYVRTAVEAGWIGLLIYCIMMFVFLKTGIDNYYKIKDQELKAYCFAGVLIIFVLNIGNYPQEALVQYPTTILFYFSIALVVATKNLDEKLNGLHEKR